MIEKVKNGSGITLIFLHGLGGCGDNWKHWLSTIVPENSRVILPTASRSYVDLVGCSTNSWFNLYSRDGSNIEELEDSAEDIHQLIDQEIKNGQDPKKIILGGFSQGSALALFSILTYPKKLGGLILLSGWYPAASRISPALAKFSSNIHSPVIHCHGDKDNKVDLKLAYQCRDILSNVMSSYQYKEVCGLGHEVNAAVQHSVAIFIKKVSSSSENITK